MAITVGWNVPLHHKFNRGNCNLNEEKAKVNRIPAHETVLWNPTITPPPCHQWSGACRFVRQGGGDLGFAPLTRSIPRSFTERSWAFLCLWCHFHRPPFLRIPFIYSTEAETTFSGLFLPSSRSFPLFQLFFLLSNFFLYSLATPFVLCCYMVLC